MSVKNRVPPNSKKNQNGFATKEILQQSQIITEILKIVFSRSEDIAILKSISDRKTGKLRVQAGYAEKSISEIEFKEDWRYSKEESLLAQIFTTKIDSSIPKKQLEKALRKMVKVSLQFEDDPTEKDFNLSEIHVQKVMSVKINQDSVFINVNEKGQTVVNLPSLSISSYFWRENFAGVNKIIEACLSADSISLYPPMYLCAKQSRNLYANEINRQKLAVEEGISAMSPNIAVVITSKKSKCIISAAKRASSPTKKSTSLSEPDYMLPLMKMMMEMNSEVDKAIKNFAAGFYERNSDGSPRVIKNKDLISKTLRARNYEKFSAINPWNNKKINYSLSTVSTLKRLHMQPEALFDLENAYFDENFNLAQRIKVIHSCLVIQNFYKERKKKEIVKKVVKIQNYFREYLIRKAKLFKKTERLRKSFYWGRLKHWYGLMVNKFREKKFKYTAIDYSLFNKQIVIIQKWSRGYLDRKNIVYWKKVFFNLRQAKEFQRFYRKKQMLWKSNEKYESLALQKSLKVNSSTDLNYSEIEDIENIYQTSPSSFKTQTKEEHEARKTYLKEAKVDRIQILNNIQ
jgi:IQ calmodulin-binding motif